MRRTVARTALVVLTLGVLGLAGGCSGNPEDPGAGPATGSPSSPTEPTSPSTSATSSGSADPGVAPATGIRLSMPHATVRAPARWTKADQIVSTETGADDPETVSLLSFGEIQAFGGTPSASELADTALAVSQYPTAPRKLAPVAVDGVEMYHLAGRVQPMNYLEEFGAVVDDRIVTLSFQFSTRVPPARREQIVDSVVATLRWK